MTGRLNGKVAIITGATSGIGARTAEVFVEHGARVVVAGRSTERGGALAARLGENALFIPTDVAKETEVKNMIEQAVDHFGRLDCLFNNAGIGGPAGPIESTPWDEYTACMNVLVGGVVMGIKHAAPVMKRQGSGSIITTTSVAGMRSGYGDHVYSLAKAAVIHLTTCVAMELGGSGIRVNAIAPGGIVTPIFGLGAGLSQAAAEERLDRVEAWLEKSQPIQRAGVPDDIALAAVYLASDESTFVNGHNLVIDGGLIGGETWSAAEEDWSKIETALKDGRGLKQ
jgi:NAD(P)-dependent dehydrogenase (short-subunit alcohol dehydrogenase family)